jgi:hypothetical protein
MVPNEGRSRFARIVRSFSSNVMSMSLSATPGMSQMLCSTKNIFQYYLIIRIYILSKDSILTITISELLHCIVVHSLDDVNI